MACKHIKSLRTNKAYTYACLILALTFVNKSSWAENSCSTIFKSTPSQIENFASPSYRAQESQRVLYQLHSLYSDPSIRFHEVQLYQIFQARYSSFDIEINRLVDLVSGQESSATSELSKNLGELNQKIFQAVLKLKEIFEKGSENSEKSHTKINELTEEIAFCKGRGDHCETQIINAYKKLESVFQEIEPTTQRLELESSVLLSVREKVINDPILGSHPEVERMLTAQIQRFTALSHIVKTAFSHQQNTMTKATKELEQYGQDFPIMLYSVLLSAKNNGLLKRDFLLKALDIKTAGYHSTIENFKVGDEGYVPGGRSGTHFVGSESDRWGDIYDVRKVKILELLPHNMLKVQILRHTFFKKTAIINMDELARVGCHNGYCTGDQVSYTSVYGIENGTVVGFGHTGKVLVGKLETASSEVRGIRDWMTIDQIRKDNQ